MPEKEKKTRKKRRSGKNDAPEAKSAEKLYRVLAPVASALKKNIEKKGKRIKIKNLKEKLHGVEKVAYFSY